MAFDASTFEIWGSLLNGATLVIYPSGSPDLEDFGNALLQERISTIWLTADLFHQMIENHLPMLNHLQFVLAGGDVLHPNMVRRLLDHTNAQQVINGYGPTENTTFSCCQILTKDTTIDGTVPIGHPISNTRVYVMDDFQQLIPLGVKGELLLGGDGLAWGYLNQPAMTAEKFIPDPTNTTLGARLYRTGDQVRWRREGTLEFIGRLDNQIKIRGFRIELGEIETVLQEHPNISKAIVLYHKDIPGIPRLVAYVLPASEEHLTPNNFRNYLKAKLPAYMVPATFILLKELPLNPNGKIDKRALPLPNEVIQPDQTPFVAPKTEIEKQLASIWQDVLEITCIGIQDNFFDLGGHSLMATQMVSRIRKKWSIDLKLTTFFESPTIQQLSEGIEALIWAKEQREHTVSSGNVPQDEGIL